MSKTSTVLELGNEDTKILPDVNIRTRRCLLCGYNGLGQFTCPKMLAYGTGPLPKNDVDIRAQLQSNMCQVSTFSVYNCNEEDTREVRLNFSTCKIAGLSMHQRLLIDNTLVTPLIINNMCVKCITLLPGGQETPRFTLVLFITLHVGAYLTKSESNLIVSLLCRE